MTLESEFHAGRPDAPRTFPEYLGLEERLFGELQQRVFADTSAADSGPIARYNAKSVVAQLALDTKYNRSYELAPPGEARGAALLVHGLSDSPYSVRALA